MSYKSSWKLFDTFIYRSTSTEVVSFGVISSTKAAYHTFFIGKITYITGGVTYEDPTYTVYMYDPCTNVMTKLYSYLYEDIQSYIGAIPEDLHVLGISNIQSIWIVHQNDLPIVVAKVEVVLDTEYHTGSLATTCVVLGFESLATDRLPGSTIQVFESFIDGYYLEYKTSSSGDKTVLEASFPRAVAQYSIYPSIAFNREVYFNHPGAGLHAVLKAFFSSIHITEVIHDNLRVITMDISTYHYTVRSFAEAIQWYYQGFDDTYIFYGNGRLAVSSNYGLVDHAYYLYYHYIDLITRPQAAGYWNTIHTIKLTTLYPSELELQSFESVVGAGQSAADFTCARSNYVMYSGKVVENGSMWRPLQCTISEFVNEDDEVSPWHRNCSTFEVYTPVSGVSFIGQVFSVYNFICPMQLLYSPDWPEEDSLWQTFWGVGDHSVWCGWVEGFKYPGGAIPVYSWFDPTNECIYVHFSNGQVYYLQLPSHPLHTAPTSLTQGYGTIFVGGGVTLVSTEGEVTYSGGYPAEPAPFYSAFAGYFTIPSEFPVSGHIKTYQSKNMIPGTEYSIVKLLDSRNVVLYGNLGDKSAMVYGLDYPVSTDITYNLPSGCRGRGFDFNFTRDTATIALVVDGETNVYTASVDDLYPEVPSGIVVFDAKSPWEFLSHNEYEASTAIRFEDDDAYFLGQVDDAKDIQGWYSGNTWDDRNGRLPEGIYITDIEEGSYNDR